MRVVAVAFLMGLIGFTAGNARQSSGFSDISDPSPTPPDSLLDMSRYKKAPEANYIYALKKADIHLKQKGESIVARIDYLVRLKVFTDSTLVIRRASLVNIPYYFDRNLEQVRNISATTFHADGTSTKLDSGQIRTINLNARYNMKEFLMPEVRKGSVIQYRYTLTRRYIEELPDFYFQHRVPTLRAKVSLHNPPYIRYRAVPVQLDNKLEYNQERIETGSVPNVFTIPQPEPLLVESWTAEHLDAVEPIPFLPNISYYRGRLKFHMTEFGMPRQPLINNWDLVAAKIRRERNPLDVMKYGKQVDTLAERLTQKVKDKKTKLDSLFRFVNRNMNHNGATAIYDTMPPQKVLKGKNASQAAINQTLLALLRKAGLKHSWPLLISTRDKGRINKDFPSPLQFNALLVATRIGEQVYIMDASFPNSYPNLIPVNMRNEVGMWLKSNSHEWLPVEVPRSRNQIALQFNGKLTKTGSLKGKLKGSVAGYPARYMRKQVASGTKTPQLLKESFFAGYESVQIDTANVTQLDQPAEPLRLYAEVTLNQYARSFQSGLAFNPMVVGYRSENPLKRQDRELPVILEAPEYLQFTYHIKLPKNRSVDSMRTDRRFRFRNGAMTERYSYQEERISYGYQIILSNYFYPPDVYRHVRTLYMRWVQLSQQSWFIRRSQ